MLTLAVQRLSNIGRIKICRINMLNRKYLSKSIKMIRIISYKNFSDIETLLCECVALELLNAKIIYYVL